MDTLKDAKFGQEFGVSKIWLDLQAEFKRPHIQGTKLASFFGKNAGPKALINVNKGYWDQTVVEVARGVTEKISKANSAKKEGASKSAASNDGGATRLKIHSIKDDEKEKKMNILREKSRDALSKKQAGKIISTDKGKEEKKIDEKRV